jgi:hypothetical protein
MLQQQYGKAGLDLLMGVVVRAAVQQQKQHQNSTLWVV